ncbi:nucleoprotein TPR-like isoform X2 [Bacillus rossius redtenbacheri]|uniref:nucleoprotein TPR-like isoform X2 n=1 Tax=Bacillus rossius redtenbacheri TaxID=93214 RepID=UPI002FDDEC5E
MYYTKNCCVPGCQNRTETRHRFPRVCDVERFQHWKRVIASPKLALISNEHIYKVYRICNSHFSADCFSPGTKRLNANCVPTLLLPGSRQSVEASSSGDGVSSTHNFDAIVNPVSTSSGEKAELKISSLEKSVLELQEEDNSDKLIEADLKVENLTQEVNALQATCERLENEKLELQKQAEDAVGKYESLANMVRNYDLQISHWKEKCAAVNADFEKLNCEYYSVVEKYMSVKGLEVDYNRRLTEAQSEWEKLSKENRRLQAEIDNITTELTIAKEEGRNDVEALKGQLAVKASELKTRQQCIDELKEKIEKDDKTIEKLSLQLKDEREDRIRQVEGLEKEIQEQAKMSHIYRQRILDDESKLGDVAEGHRELLELIAHGERKCKSLESELWKAGHNCRRHEENSQQLEKEVDRLNAELAKCRNENVTRSIDELYPMIGASRQLLKNDISFTELLRQYSKASDEIFSLKKENLDLKHSIDKLAKELEAVFPYLKVQKEDYTKALQTIDDQVRQMDEIKVALTSAENEKQQSENDRRMCESVVMDLSKQVQYLTAQLESARRGMFANKYPQNHDDSSQVDNIFGSIEELQMKNVKLLKKIKIMSEKEMVLQEEIANIQQTNAEVLLKEQQRCRQTELAVDEHKEISSSLRQQLKVYQNMYKNKLDDGFGEIPFAVPESTTAVQTDMTLYDFENLLRDKAGAERLARDLGAKADALGTELQESERRLDEARAELRRARGVGGALRAELDHARQAFAGLGDARDALRRQVALLEGQCRELCAKLAGRDAELQSLRAAVKAERDAGLRQADSLRQCRREQAALAERERRLRDELDQVRRCEAVLAAITAGVEALKAGAERRATRAQEELGADMGSAMEECSVLRRLLQDKYKEMDKLELEKENAVKLQLDQEEKFNDELKAAREEIEVLGKEISNLKNSIKECALKRSELMDEKEKLQEEIAARNSEVKEHIARCEEYQSQLRSLAAELEQSRVEAAARNEGREERLKEISELREKLSNLEKEEAAKSVSNAMEEKENKLKSQQEKFESILELGKQMNVDKELSMHSEAMVELMRDVTLKSDEIVKLKAEIEKLYADLGDVKNDFKQKETNLENECAQLQKHISILEGKNSLLCEQLKVFDAQQFESKETQSSEPGVVVIDEVATPFAFKSESVQPLVPGDGCPEQHEADIQEVETIEVLSCEDNPIAEPSNSEQLESAYTEDGGAECALVDDQPYVTGKSELAQSVAVGATQSETSALRQEAAGVKSVHNIGEPRDKDAHKQSEKEVRTSIGSRRSSRRTCSNYRKKDAVREVFEPGLRLTFKKTAVTVDSAGETFQVNMPGGFEVLGENPAGSKSAQEPAVDDDGIVPLTDQHRVEMEFHGEQELEDSFDAEQGEFDNSSQSEEGRDFAVLQPLPPTFEYIAALSAPEEIDLTPGRPARERSPPSSRPARGSGTARRSRGTFKSHRKRSSSGEESPAPFTKVSRRK